MSAINDLIAQIEDEGLRQRIDAEVKRLLKQKKFGLVFEEHQPDGLMEGPIYPSLQVLDQVQNAPDKALWHALIEADNFYALQLLAYLYPGMVDCIYIDPPYNTGARDWKYNNDYVDSADQYRHSKWLSMMKRRLLLAKKLLNPRDSVLIVTIDEKEYLHLGCLLEEMFPEARIQMVNIIINKNGVSRSNAFKRSEEYAFFVMFGESGPVEMETSTYSPFIDEEQDNSEDHVRWEWLLRGGSNSLRTDRPNLFYPIYIDESSRTIKQLGQPIPLSVDRRTVPDIEGLRTLWPLRTDGTEATWRMQPSSLQKRIDKGFVRIGAYDQKKDRYSILYIADVQEERINKGDIVITGKRADGSVIVEYANSKKSIPTTVWGGSLFSAAEYGSKIITKVFGDKRFQFPKSFYATKLTIAPFVANKPNALIIDFFAGSGTTLHAVNLLNAEDGGNRRCIMVTNNEVSEQEAKTLTKQGFKPGDEEWERLGIARYVNWPRTVCSIEGHDVNGLPLKGEYLGTDHRQMKDGFAANCVFFKLNFLDKRQVALGRQFHELLPILWMKAGGEGPCPQLDNEEIPQQLILPENRFAVLTDEKAFTPFMESVIEYRKIRMVYLVVDSDSMYREMARCFPNQQTCQLYRDYLDNFRINQTR